MNFPQTGGCLCGAVRYQITSAPILIYTCHCTACQTLTGTAFSMAALIMSDACHFASQQTRCFHRRADSGREVTWWVCSNCGTWICTDAQPGTAPAGTFIRLRAGTFDDTSWLRPTAHFWTRSAQPWVAFPAADMRFETQPDNTAAWLQTYLG
jgi:hypothetical protein